MDREAIAQCDTAVENSPNDPAVLGLCGRVYGSTSRRQQALALLDRLKTLSTRCNVDPYLFAHIYAGLGDTDRELEWLERCVSEHSANATSLGAFFWSDRLRADPRYKDLLRRMNLSASTSP